MSKKKTRPIASESEGDVTPSSEDNGALVFDLDRVVIPVKIGEEDYELKEATGDAACRWRNAIINKTTLNSDGTPQSTADIADTEPILVALCLYPKGSDKNVSTATVRSWPARIQKALFNKAKEISDLDDEEDPSEEDPTKD